MSSMSRLALALLVFVTSIFASESIVSGQDNQWTPYREANRSREQVARRVQQKQIRLPPPVRLAQYQSPKVQTIQDEPFEEADTMSMESSPTVRSENQQASHPMLGSESMNGFAPAPQAHVVIRSPAMQAKSRKQGSSNRALGTSTFDPGFQLGGHQAGHSDERGGLLRHSDDQHLPAPPLHGTNSKLAKKKWPLGPIQPRQATIPGAQTRPKWKQPYSYGYFGSKSTRHWGTHHGYRDRYTEYRYR